MHQVALESYKSFVKTVVCILATFSDNSGIRDGFTKYLKESCLYCSESHCSFEYLSNFAFVCNILLKLSGCFWPQRVLMS